MGSGRRWTPGSAPSRSFGCVRLVRSGANAQPLDATERAGAGARFRRGKRGESGGERPRDRTLGGPEVGEDGDGRRHFRLCPHGRRGATSVALRSFYVLLSSFAPIEGHFSSPEVMAWLGPP